MIAYLLILMGIFLRLVPHVPNVAPVAAIALFSGVYLDKRIVPWVPLAIMAVSDILIGFHDMVLFTWGAFLLIGFIGMWLRDRKSPGTIMATTVLSSILFFVISNFGVWLVWYPMTPAGLVDCYVKALPFLRNTMAGNVIFAFIMFGAYELARRLVSGKSFERLLLTS